MATRATDLSLPSGEFELIERIFAPLAAGFTGAFDLKDDVAVLEAKPGHELVLKTDSTIENVHFLAVDPPESIARKALRRALSDIVAKGAAPAAYLLALALPPTTARTWIEKFAEGLGADQAEFHVALAGGETSKTPGMLTITVTALGWVASGRLLRRNGAKPGDDVWVTGTIGDAAAGLAVLKNEVALRESAARDYLVRRFRIPEPRSDFGASLGNIANASIDISDGLIADLGHVAGVSGATIEVRMDDVPISVELRTLWGGGAETVRRAVSSGDDYEIAFTAPAGVADEIAAAANRTHTTVTRIGRVVGGAPGVRLLDSSGLEVRLQHQGYSHF